MRWGCCGDLERLETIEAAGYEFIESPVRVLCVDEPPPAADRYRDAIRSSSLTVEALNVFLPGTLPIIGPDVNNDSLRKHVDTIISRISGLGTEIIVLGSGGARMIPEGWDRSTARDQLLAFCNLAADIAGPAGITIVIEPLCSDACNYILTVSEALYDESGTFLGVANVDIGFLYLIDELLDPRLQGIQGIQVLIVDELGDELGGGIGVDSRSS